MFPIYLMQACIFSISITQVLFILEYTNLTAVETDGPYGGYSCSATNHSHHQGESDSVYRQNLLQGQFFTILREKEMYINQPDNYFFQGGSKTVKFTFQLSRQTNI